MQLFKKILLQAGLGTLLSIAFLGCGDNGSSTSSAEISSSSSEEATSSSEDFSTSLSITIDKKKQVITFEEFYSSIGKCLVKDNKIQWGYISHPITLDPYKYDFVGDSLVLYYGYGNDSFESAGGMYVGGTANKIEGVWTPTPCSYDRSSPKTRCQENIRDEQYPIEITEDRWTFIVPDSIKQMNTENKVYIVNNEEIKPINHLYYRRNGIRTELIESFYTGKIKEMRLASQLIYNYFNGRDEYVNFTDSLLEALGIESLSAGDSGETFIMGGNKYSIKVTRADYVDYNDHSAFTELQVTSGKTTCTFYDEDATNVYQFLCNEENAKYFEQVDSTDVAGNEFTYVLNYRKSNATEFYECLEKIAPEPTGSEKQFEKLVKNHWDI